MTISKIIKSARMTLDSSLNKLSMASHMHIITSLPTEILNQKIY